MGLKKLLIKEKTRVLTMLENVVPVIRWAANLHVSIQTIYDQNGRQQGFHLALHYLKSGNWSQEEDHSEDRCTYTT